MKGHGTRRGESANGPWSGGHHTTVMQKAERQPLPGSLDDEPPRGTLPTAGGNCAQGGNRGSGVPFGANLFFIETTTYSCSTAWCGTWA